MLCNYKTKKGILCKNEKLKNSSFCYLKSHYPTNVEYKNTIDNLKKEWENDTYSIDLFTKHNVPEDGWCLYHSFGMVILNKFLNKTNNTIINSFFNNPIFSKYILNNNTNNIIFQKELRYRIYNISKKWLKDNLKNKHDQTNETIHDFILNTNNIDNINEYFSEESKNVNIQKDLSEEYWGGICEQYALSKYFQVDLIVFFPSRYSFLKNEKRYSTVISKVVRKNITRYKLSSCCFGNIHSDNSDKSKILPLLKNNVYFNNILQDTKKDEYNMFENTIENTVFLLLFILGDNNNNISHYNYLILKT